MMDFKIGDKVKYIRSGEIGIIEEIEKNYKFYSTRYSFKINMGKKTLNLMPMIEERVGDYIEKVDKTTPYEPYTQKLKGVPIQSIGKNMYKEARTQVPIDTTTKFKDMSDDELVDIFAKEFKEFAEKTRYDLPTYAFELPYLNYDNKGEKEMIGLPYSVNFVEKHKRTTLVWRFAKIRMTVSLFNYYVSEEYYETTKAEAHNEKFSHLYGFLMAYFKRVHQGKSKTQLKKYLNTVVYPMSKMSQLAFLQGVFYENCGLDYKEAKEYLQKIEKGESVNAETK